MNQISDAKKVTVTKKRENRVCRYCERVFSSRRLKNLHVITEHRPDRPKPKIVVFR